MNWDVIVTGAGIAGWTAALRATQLGASVLLVDKARGEMGGGNSLMNSGSFYCAGLPPNADPEALAAKVLSQGIATPALVRAWAGSCGRAVDWLREAGVDVFVMPHTGQHWLEYESRVCQAPLYRQDVGTNTLGKLKAAFESSGGTFWPSTQALRLQTPRPGAVSGAVLDRDGAVVDVAAKAVILTTGGFSANPEMLSRYVGPLAGECKLRCSANATGDGLRMALEVGAGAVNLAYFYGHLQSLKCLIDDRFWPYPRLDSLVTDGILVDRAGRRFVDEGRGDVAVSNLLARGDDPRGACLIFDEPAWERARRDEISTATQIPGANPWLMEHDGELYSAPTTQALSSQLAIDGRSLAATIETYNAGERPVPRTGRSGPLDGPLYAIRVVPGITFTMGGIQVDGQLRAMDREGLPIAGLRAAGDAIGGLMGGFDGGYTGGLSQAVVTGLLAAESVAGHAVS